jgi:hypothetical protein
MNRGLIHKVVVLSKDFYVIRTIDDLFIFAGADSSWWQEPSEERIFDSERVNQVYGWIEGIKLNNPEQLRHILQGVIQQMCGNEKIPEDERDFLKRHIDLPVTEGFRPPVIPDEKIVVPEDVKRLLEILIKGLPQAMYPLKHRRKDLPFLTFENEYDVQDLLHVMLRPWIRDVRPEEYTPSYAGSSTRIDFLCADYDIVIEVKYVRDTKHAKKVGDELIIDITHYAVHPQCNELWIVIYDADGLIPNPGGLIKDLNGEHTNQSRTVQVRAFVLNG